MSGRFVVGGGQMQGKMEMKCFSIRDCVPWIIDDVQNEWK
jgi:hypothetical protein